MTSAEPPPVIGTEPAPTRARVNSRALRGALVLLAAAIVWVMAFTGGFSSLFSSSRTIKADFSNIEQVAKGDPVRIDGVQIGIVGGITQDADRRGATLDLSLRSGPRIYANASATIKWRTLLGGVDAVVLDPGTPGAGLLGDRTISRSVDSSQVELDQITGALRGGAQTGLRTMLQQLPIALADHPALGSDLRILAKIAPAATTGLRAVRGEMPDVDLRAFVRNTAQAARGLDVGIGARTTQRFLESAATTLDAMAPSPTALAQTVVAAGVLLPQASAFFPRLDTSLTRVDRLVDHLSPDVPNLAPTLRALRPAVSDAGTLLHRATPLLHALDPTVLSLRHTAIIGAPVIDAVAPSLERLSKTVFPGLDERYPEEGGRPEYEMLGSIFSGLGELADFFDQNGNNAALALSEDDEGAAALPCSLDFSGTDLLVCESLSDSLQLFFTGGTSLLQSFVKNPTTAAAVAPFLRQAEHAQAGLQSLKQKLAAKLPAVARLLFSANHGGRG